MAWWIFLSICVILFLICWTVADGDFFWPFIFGGVILVFLTRIGMPGVVFVCACVVLWRIIFNVKRCLGMFVCSVLILIGGLCFFDISTRNKEPEGTFLIGNPIVQESRYEILAGNDTTRVDGSVSGYFYWGSGSVSGSISEDSFYKIYYLGTNAEGENIAIPKIIKENETQVVLCPDDTECEYLIETVTTQQYVERKWYRYSEERYFEDVLCKYKLYVRESTFNNKVVLDSN